MAKPKPAKAMSAKADQRRLRWLGRWLLKLTGWFFALSLVIVLIGTVVAWFAWKNLTGLANMAASQFVAPYRVELGLVDVSKRGEVHIKEVTLLPPPDLADEKDSPWVHLDGLDLTYDWDELRNDRRFRTVTLRGPVIRIDDASLEFLNGGESAISGEESEKVTPDLAFLGRLADRVEVTGGELVIDTSKAPRLEAKWDLSVPPIDFGDEEWLTREPIGFRLQEVKLGKSAELGTVERINLSGRIRSDLRGVEIAELAFAKPEVTVTPEWMPSRDESSEATPPSEKTSEKPTVESADNEAFEVLVGAFRVLDGKFTVRGFDENSDGPVLPEVAMRSSIDWRDLRIKGGEISSSKALDFVIDDLEIDAHAQPGSGEPATATIERFAVSFVPQDLLDRKRIESIQLTSPEAFLTPESTVRLLNAESSEEAEPDSANSSEGTEVESGSTNPELEWEIGSLAVTGGAIEARDWMWEERAIPSVSLDWEMALAEFSQRSFSSEGEASLDEPGQRVALSNVKIGEHDAGGEEEEVPALLTAASMEAEFRFGKLFREHRIDAFRMQRPLLDFTDEKLPEWVVGYSDSFGGASESEEAKAESPVAPVFSAGEIQIDDGVMRLDTEAFGGRIPKMQGRFSLANLAEAEGDTPTLYRFELDEFRVRSQQGKAMPGSASSEPSAENEEKTEALGGLFPQDPDPDETVEDGGSNQAGRSGAIRERDVAFVRQLKVDFSAEGVQRDRRIEKIEVKGAEFQVGEGLREMVDDGSDAEVDEDAADGEAQAAAMDRTGEWTVGEFVITESQVRFESLVPQIEGLEFGIETRLMEIPLSQGGLLAQDRKQKVELASIEIRDPYNSFGTVAFLPTIFVEFSFAGLVNQRINRIDLISPSIYVGEQLFRWVDYQRNYRKQNEGAGFGVEGQAVSEPADEDETGRTWEISEIEAHFGKIVIAPTGRPLGVVPFPFNAQTNMENGEIELKLEIPREEQYVYRFPNIQLDLYGLQGDVQFNVPIQQESNNLVQTFELERAIWKQYQVENLYLTVTYDENGIYGRFGGEAYSGYAEGQFNIYLKDVGTWDAWLAGTTFDMGPVTEVVAPDNFIMDGEVNAKLVSEGNGLIFGETWGEIEAVSPGRIDFTKLDEFIADLPDDWSILKKSTTKLSLETLKQFDYQSGRGDLYFLNQDGWLRLDLEGDSGSRRLELYAHDWRGKDEKKEPEATVVETVTEAGDDPEKAEIEAKKDPLGD